MALRHDRTALVVAAALLTWPLAGYPACLRVLAGWRSGPYGRIQAPRYHPDHHRADLQ